MYWQLVKIGGDTDTNCSLAGHITETLIGGKNIPEKLVNKLSELKGPWLFFFNCSPNSKYFLFHDCRF